MSSIDIFCPSTHGLAGYAPGSYKTGDVVICGFCGKQIQDPRPTGYYEYTTGWLWWKKKHRQPLWNFWR